MQIFIKRMTGKVVTIDASDSDTILVIKEKFEDKEGLSPEQVCLIFPGGATPHVPCRHAQP